MAQRSHVPKFGNWESEENVPYTAYFDKARKGKTGGKLINPNDPQENPDAFTDDATPVPLRAASDPGVPPPEASKPKHERRSSKEDAELRRQTDSPAARHDPGARRGSSDSSHLRHGDRGVNSSDPKKGNRISGGSDRSIEHSPLHPTYQAKVASKGGVSSPSWERKGASEGSQGLAPNTPGRSRLRNAARGDETPEKGAAVPKFGDWDETNPSSADGYTHIFNKVREEKQIGAAKVPVMPTESSYNNNHRQDNARNSETTMCWCFPMSRK
ncbi:RPM1-interacting protein 4-like [Magnolia sinica]|uniref:RPM1-interacting protein 4-like n=1 Tax=Magnolia sinica TaxID=86752 RepID=UPI002659F2DF|nr:RPM1-interacting protein 4-like [Magnolia sinica]